MAACNGGHQACVDAERWRPGVGSGCGYLLARGGGRIAQRRAGAGAVAALTRLRRQRCYAVLYPPRYVFANGVLSPHACASDPEVDLSSDILNCWLCCPLIKDFFSFLFAYLISEFGELGTRWKRERKYH